VLWDGRSILDQLKKLATIVVLRRRFGIRSTADAELTWHKQVFSLFLRLSPMLFGDQRGWLVLNRGIFMMLPPLLRSKLFSIYLEANTAFLMTYMALVGVVVQSSPT
jgi:hypothetical protein